MGVSSVVSFHTPSQWTLIALAFGTAVKSYQLSLTAVVPSHIPATAINAMKCLGVKIVPVHNSDRSLDEIARGIVEEHSDAVLVEEVVQAFCCSVYDHFTQ